MKASSFFIVENGNIKVALSSCQQESDQVPGPDPVLVLELALALALVLELARLVVSLSNPGQARAWLCRWLSLCPSWWWCLLERDRSLSCPRAESSCQLASYCPQVASSYL